MPPKAPKGRSKSVKPKARASSKEVVKRNSTLDLGNSSEITRIVILSSAASENSAALTEVYSSTKWASSQKQLSAVVLPGLGEIEFALSDDEEERCHPTDNAHVRGGAALRRGSQESLVDHENTELENAMAALPTEASNHIANDAHRTKRCKRATARFKKLLTPLDAALAEALIGTEQTQQNALQEQSPPLVTGTEGVPPMGSGVGHPVIRIMQRIIKGGKLQDNPTTSTFRIILELTVAEFFRQCPLSNGTTAVNSVIELTRSCFSTLGPLVPTGIQVEPPSRITNLSPPFSRETEEDFLGAWDLSATDSATFCLRETWLQTLHPSLFAMRTIFGATRADSPDVHLHFLEVGIVDKTDTFAMVQTKSSSRGSFKRSRRAPGTAHSRSPPRRQMSAESSIAISYGIDRVSNSRGGRGQLTSPPEPSSPKSAKSASENMLDNTLPLSNNASSEQLGMSPTESLTAAGARRLQFWDGFFSYRSLGAVSRELAAKQLEPEKDSEEDDPLARKYLMYNVTPKHGMKDSTSSKNLSAFSSLIQNTSMFEASMTVPSSVCTPRSPRGAQAHLDVLFPSLDQRRRYVHLKTLRRPPGATAEPPERGFLSRHTRNNNNDVSSPVERRTPRKDERDLPPLVAAAKTAMGLSPRQQGAATLINHGREVPTISRITSPELSKDAIVKDPLMFPMFMNVASTQKQEEEHAMSFATNGVGFEVQPLTIAKARRAANNEDKARAAHKGQVDARGRGISKRWSSSTTASAMPTDRRCRYCVHHNIHPSSGNNAMAAKWEQKAGIRQRTCASIPGAGLIAASIHLCAACGDDTDAPFNPRAPRLLVDASQGTPLDPAPSSLLARIRSPGLGASKQQRTGRLSVEIPKAAIENTADAINGQSLLNATVATEGLDETTTKTSPKRHAGFAYGLPKRVLSENLDINKVAVGNVYFVACEKNHARPLPEGPAALTESGALIDTSTNRLRIYCDPTSTQASQGDDVYVSLRGADLDDSGLAAFIESLTQKGADFEGAGIHIDLARNRLTDTGLHRFLSSLEEPLGWVRRLETLDFAQNRLLTATAIEPLYALLAAEKLPRLRTLRLGGIELTESFTLRLFKGIDAASSANLEELDISFLGLGRAGPAAPAAAAALIRQCQALFTLDMSGNYLNIDAISALGDALSEVSYVQTLHFAHNTGNWPAVVGSVPDKHQDFLQARQSNPPGGNAGTSQPFEPQPCTAMCGLWVYLSKIPALRVLDLRDAQVDPRCAFMLACAVFEHRNLEAILLNGNPLGVYGVRALLAKAYLSEAPPDVSESHLSVLTLDQCDEGSMLALDIPSMPLSDPSGSYVFDLRDPWSSTALQDCLHQWKSHKQFPFDQAFPYIDIDGKLIKEIASSPDGTWQLPRSGVISFTCLLPRNRQPHEGTHAFRIRPQDYHRRPLSPELEQRALRIAATCHSLVSLQVLVQALAADFWLRGVVVKTLCQWMSTMGSAGAIAQIAAAELLSDCVIDAECDLEFLEILCAPRLIPSPSSLRKHYCVQDYVCFGNPTGHYVFNLTWPSDRILAEDFLVFSNWEAEVAKASCLPDRSQFGNYQYLRNEALNAKNFVYRPDWVLPAAGIFEFDISVPKRWSKAAKAMGEETWQKLKAVLKADTTPAMMKVFCLRRFSSQLCLTSLQALDIFTLLTKGDRSSASGKRGFPSPVEMTLLCVLIFRIKDYQNTRQTFFKDPGPFGSIERLKCCERLLGCLNIADPLHINTELKLNLDVHEERQYCRMVLNIAFQEGGRTLDPKSFAGCAYGPENSELHLFPSGAPPDRWLKTGLPRRGVLAFTYIAEDGNARFRKRQAQLVCGWEV